MAFYEGDSAFSSSDSAPVTVNADLRDFSLVFPVSQLVLAAGNSASVTLNLGSLTGSETVTLTCTTSSSSLGCTVPSTPLTVNGNATATVTITTYMSVSGLQKQHSGGRFLWIRAGSVGMFAFVFLLGCGKRQRGWRMLLGINMIVVLALVIGCGGGSVSSVQSAATATPTPTPTPQSSASPTPTPTPTSQSSASPTPTPTPQAAATVGSVLVTGTGSNGTVHTVRLTVLVQ